MGGDEAFDRFAAVLFGRHAATGQHVFQRAEKLLGNREILRVAGVMEGNQDFVRQAAAMPGGKTRSGGIAQFVVAVSSITHACDSSFSLRTQA